jgi:fluoride exporter
MGKYVSKCGYETITLFQSNKEFLAGLYVLASVIVSIVTAAIGFIFEQIAISWIN